PRSRAWFTALRRRSGLRSFPTQYPSAPDYPGSGSLLAVSASHSPAPVPSAASPGRSANRRTPCASGSTSALQSPHPCKPVLLSCRLQSPLQSAEAGSPPAPVDIACRVPYALLVPVSLSFTGTFQAGHSTSAISSLTTFPKKPLTTLMSLRIFARS